MRKLAWVSLGVLAACSGGVDGNGGGGVGGGAASSTAAQLQVDLVDAPARELTEVIVTISRVTAHSNVAGWVTIMDTPVTVDLLKLRTQAATLGLTQTLPGRITQFRLYVSATPAAYVTTPDGAHHPLRVPSGEQSGIKVKGLWNTADCERTTVTLDFDAHKSIWVHPTGRNSDEYILRPVILKKRVRHTTQRGCHPNPGGGDDPADGEVPPGNGHGNPNNPGGGNTTPDDPEPGDDCIISDGSTCEPPQFVDGSSSSSGGGGETSSGGTPVDPGTGTSSGGGGGDIPPPAPGAPCGTHSDCGGGAYCGLDDVCVPTLDPGAACETDAQCNTGLCVNAVCGFSG